ncbi:bifunctional tRNA (5-methylaminomethyl-2-thiouridine)(34)-methyltransferase MnmD/FAD-dependent 5-carboxymethylaminomethyl-2-thiouridine(34) oxidoreductase MnmC [Paludibacterium paludis]|uniref:tRNA 5-methylaminomethyl-2-thiouridine biosynthesis bifunctional protein MnmC n=1 Tax=Paludibacterium paludis TaxID=1225769 RepID=A0A918NZ81_9NEIS|nr:bifunctional tRNA (5-methylaminomethyl-2-thiouridine)(34)-methyltransferase MnmD/FAD-dependent 5-carboxymethylaminomethyl-2-thiouridine(34) oxidoreductase MnmC [Paludibacterium paludis]GGY06938.1 tRNA 5-methylaminomethyl-2-thiouridine biosynthesis bifunctional protein MnmC [Paludibacterium paludis]
MTHNAELDWRDGQPFSTTFGDVYFSRTSGLDETRHVFLDNNRLAERFAALAPDGVFTIAETGFGTGLNVLCAWQCFEEHAPPGARLDIVSMEKHPLSREDLARALALWPELSDFSGKLLAQYGVPGPGWHRLVLAEGRVTLTLVIGDALDTIQEIDTRVDAWFLDGFAPSKNPGMWHPELFSAMARLGRDGATFATFTCAGAVRRGLAEAGFHVEKVPGHGQKREMCRGVLIKQPEPEWEAPWYARPPLPAGRSAIVVGGGLAGAASARSLAARGWQVTLVERHPALAAEGSGNPQGVLYAKLSAHFTPLTRLILSGYGFSLRTLSALLGPDTGAWRSSGVLQLGFDEEERKRQAQLAAAGLPEDFVRAVTEKEASALAGIPLSSPGLFFPEGGWAHPPALVAAMTDHPNITVRAGQPVIELDRNPVDGEWIAVGPEGPLAIGSVVVLASAADTADFDSTCHLPLKRIRGQITQARATAGSRRLNTVLCAEGYISPERGGSHCLGATFTFNDDGTDVRDSEHDANLAMLAGMAPALHAALGEARSGPQVEGGRAAFRCTSPDYLPMIGPVVRQEDFVAAWPELARDATSRPATPAPWCPGLYVNTAHGSRGLVTAPLSGEILASYLCGETAPLPSSLMRAVHPNRFLLRDLSRGKLTSR